MSVVLSGIRHPLAHFTIELEITLAAPVTGLFGSSGAGKTSVLELIAGLRRPSRGQVVIDGQVVTDTGQRIFVPPEHRGLGYVPQDGALFPHLTVRQNLLFGYHPRRRTETELTPEHVAAVLEISGLEHRSIQTLSGGEQRRVALARALLAGPRLLLLDEPLSGIDAPLRDRLLPYFQRMRDEFGIPMLYVTHAPEEVMQLCDDVVVIADGKIEARGKPGDLFEATGPSFRRKSLSANPTGRSGDR